MDLNIYKNICEANIGFDLDGVLLDLFGSVKKSLDRIGINIDMDSLKEYNADEHECKEEIIKCFHNPYVFLNADPFKGSYELMKFLYNKNIKFFIETISLNEKIANIKEVWLSKYFPFIKTKDVYHRIGKDAPKFYKDATIVVEDNPYYIETSTFKNSNHIVALMDRSYNKKIESERVIRIYDYDQLKNLIVSKI